MTDYKALGDRELLESILLAEQQSAIHAKMAKSAKEELLHRRRGDIAAAYAAKESQFGLIHVAAGDYRLDVTTSQKVDWDQEQLAAHEKEIPRAMERRPG